MAWVPSYLVCNSGTFSYLSYHPLHPKFSSVNPDLRIDLSAAGLEGEQEWRQKEQSDYYNHPDWWSGRPKLQWGDRGQKGGKLWEGAVEATEWSSVPDGMWEL